MRKEREGMYECRWGNGGYLELVDQFFERKIYRTIYGPKYEKGERKSPTNRELEEMSKGENIVKWIKGQRISWLGHLQRMEEDRMHKKSSLKNWKGREEGEDSGNDAKRK